MPESSKEYRAHFSKKEAQQKWITDVRNKMSVTEIASLCKCSERTIRDWQREKFFMDYSCVEKICQRLSMSIPAVKKVDRFAHTKAAGKRGGKAVIDKYGRVPVEEFVRKKSWLKWWSANNHNVAILQAKDIKKPKKSADLAEFMGIMMGDGTVAPYHIAVTLDSVADREYCDYVTSLIISLFGIQSKIYKKRDRRALDIVVSRKKLVQFVCDLGLPKGNKIKNGLAIPVWILQSKSYAQSCVRGLMDTDGSAFTHRYTSNGKKYSYKKWSFTSASKVLRSDLAGVLTEAGITCSCSGSNVRIEARDSVERYNNLIGSNNPKHLKRMLK